MQQFKKDEETGGGWEEEEEEGENAWRASNATFDD